MPLRNRGFQKPKARAPPRSSAVHEAAHLPLIPRHESLARFSGSSIIALLLGGECRRQIIRFKPLQPSPVPSVFPHVHEGLQLHRRVACHRCRSRSMMAGFGGPARGCDACRAAPSAVYCPADAAFLCGGCDAQVHGANRVASRHERVWVCEACEVGPAVLFCCADSAALCAACDAEVHSANPLACRHQRVPILSVPLPAAAGTAFLSPTEELHRHNSEEDEAESWLLINTKNCDNQGALFSSDQVDGYFDLVSYNDNACNEIRNQEQQIQLLHQQQSEGVVPSALCLEQQQRLQKQEEGYALAMEYEVSNCTAGFSYTANSTSNSVSFTSMDASIVPRTRVTHISDTHNFANSNGPNKLLPCPPLPQMALQFPMDREAKVLKYREKRKTRKFSKTIRYELRKTYAEMRPRIKGRFAKQSDAEHEMEQMFSTLVPSDGGYGIVPSF